MPIEYCDERGISSIILEDTPDTSTKKEQMRLFLRQLVPRFLDGSRLALNVEYVTKNWHPIDADNVVRAVQNAGNRVIWTDDSKFVSVLCHHGLTQYKHVHSERTVVYVSEIPKEYWNDRLFIDARQNLMNEDCRDRYDEKRHLQAHFTPPEIQRYASDGFWVDARFFEVPALAAGYQVWLIGKRNRGS